MNRDDEDVPSELAALYRAERPIDPVSEHDVDRAWARFASLLPGGGGGGGGSGGDGGGGDGGAGSANAAGSSAAGAGAAGSSVSGASGATSSAASVGAITAGVPSSAAGGLAIHGAYSIAHVIAGVIAGAAIGGATTWMIVRPQVASAPRAEVSAPSADSIEEPLEPPVSEPLAVVPALDGGPGQPAAATTETETAERAPRAAPEPAHRLLALERRSIDAARFALARGDVDAALARVVEHRRRFPSGELAEERDGVEIQALVRGGRRDEARARAETFLARYPRSLFRHVAVEALRLDR